MNITDDMILRACYTWTGDSRPLQVEKEAMRKVLTEFAAALAAQRAEPTGAAWVDAHVSGPPALMQAMRIHAEAATPAAAAVPQTLPPLPDAERALSKIRSYGDARVHREVGYHYRQSPTLRLLDCRNAINDQMTAYARTCAAAWGVTLDDTGDSA